jgi:hypothetical protein
LDECIRNLASEFPGSRRLITQAMGNSWRSPEDSSGRTIACIHSYPGEHLGGLGEPRSLQLQAALDEQAVAIDRCLPKTHEAAEWLPRKINRTCQRKLLENSSRGPSYRSS